MTKILIFCLIFLNLFFPSLALSRDFLNPDRADTSYPEDLNDIYNYVPPVDETTSHTQIIFVQNSFDPNQIGVASPSGEPIFDPYDVTKLEKEQDPQARPLLKSFNEYTGNSFKNPLSSPDILKKAFSSLNLRNQTGASNLGQRFLSQKDHRCLASKRLIQAVNTLDPAFRSDTILDNKITIPDKTLRLSQLAYLLKDQPIFYATNLPCNSQSTPTTLLNNPSLSSAAKSVFLSKSVNSILNPNEALRVFNSLPVTADSDAAPQYVDIYENHDGQMVYIKTVPINQVGLGGLASSTNQSVFTSILPQKASVTKYDYGQTSPKLAPNISDTTSPLNFIARILKFFGTIFDQGETYSDSTQIIVKNPAQAEKASDTTSTAIRHLLPAKSAKHLEDTPGSYTTEGSDLPNPGQPVINSLNDLAKHLQPAAWQKTTY